MVVLTPQQSWDIPADAGFLCDKTAVFGEAMKKFCVIETSVEICLCNVTSRMCLEMKMLAGWQQIPYGESGNKLVKLYHIRLNSVNRTVTMVSLDNTRI